MMFVLTFIITVYEFEYTVGSFLIHFKSRKHHRFDQLWSSLNSVYCFNCLKTVKFGYIVLKVLSWESHGFWCFFLTFPIMHGKHFLNDSWWFSLWSLLHNFLLITLYYSKNSISIFLISGYVWLTNLLIEGVAYIQHFTLIFTLCWLICQWKILINSTLKSKSLRGRGIRITMLMINWAELLG